MQTICSSNFVSSSNFFQFKLFGIEELGEFWKELVSRGGDSQALQDSQDSPSLPSSQSSEGSLAALLAVCVAPRGANFERCLEPQSWPQRGAPLMLWASRRP